MSQLVKTTPGTLALVPSHAETMEVAEVLAQSGAFPTVQHAAQAYAVILIGQSFGMGPGEALMAISLIQGKPSFDVHWQAKRIIELGHYYEIVELDGQKCTIRAWRNVGGTLTGSGTVTMNMDRAKQIAINDREQKRQDDKAKSTLGNKWNYKSWAEDMLYAYCMRRVVRRYFPEVLGGYGGGDADSTLAEMADDGVIEGETVTLEQNVADLTGQAPPPHDPETGEVLNRNELLKDIEEARNDYGLSRVTLGKWVHARFDRPALVECDDAQLVTTLQHIRRYHAEACALDDATQGEMPLGDARSDKTEAPY